MYYLIIYIYIYIYIERERERVIIFYLFYKLNINKIILHRLSVIYKEIYNEI